MRARKVERPARSSAAGLLPTPRKITPKDILYRIKCPRSIATRATRTGAGIHGGRRRTKSPSHSGTLPPGRGSTISPNPSQTNDAPKVTTIEGRRSQWIKAPIKPYPTTQASSAAATRLGLAIPATMTLTSATKDPMLRSISLAVMINICASAVKMRTGDRFRSSRTPL
jgi:hypothetical protein